MVQAAHDALEPHDDPTIRGEVHRELARVSWRIGALELAQEHTKIARSVFDALEAKLRLLECDVLSSLIRAVTTSPELESAVRLTAETAELGPESTIMTLFGELIRDE